TLSASAAIGVAMMGWGAASADDGSFKMADATAVSGVTVEGTKTFDPKAVAVDRLPDPEKAPQTVHVIDPEIIEQQAITTLDQAVRNVPGITANVGEGGGAVAGDQFRIRGFDAQNDISTDGLRDFGVYTRDAFNIEAVQVYLGPSGQSFGRGS